MWHSPHRLSLAPTHDLSALPESNGAGPQPRCSCEAMLQAPFVRPKSPELAADIDGAYRHSADVQCSEACSLKRPLRMVVAASSGRLGALHPMLELLRLQGLGGECFLETSCGRLTAAVNRCEAKLLLLDLETIKVTAMDELLAVRRQIPDVPWLLASHSGTPPCVDLVMRFQARGCINLEALDTTVRAIETVLAGDVWFPRWMTDHLYERLLTELCTTYRRNHHAETPAKGALTHREDEVMSLIAEGLTNKEVARQLSVSVNTVKKHLKNAFEKRGLHSRRQALC